MREKKFNFVEDNESEKFLSELKRCGYLVRFTALMNQLLYKRISSSSGLVAFTLALVQ